MKRSGMRECGSRISLRSIRATERDEPMPRSYKFLLCVLAAFAANSPVHSQTWPSRPITMVVPFPPGPGLDLLARLVGAKLGEWLGVNVVVENRTGANG